MAAKNTGVQDYRSRAAASKVVMRSGRHFARFTVMSGNAMFGVIPPGWDMHGGTDAPDVDGHCFFGTYGGERYPSGIGWQGMQRATRQSDRIGMLLDLDQGSMTVWKNDMGWG